MNPAALLSIPGVDLALGPFEQILRDSVVSGDPFLDEVTTHLIDAGGKRLRPALTVAAATSDGREATKEDLLGGVAVELVHLASLYHDDVMDEATMRRNVESVNARWGNLVAIVAGDFLLARSAEIAAGLGTEVAELLAATLGRLCQGQVAEVRGAYRADREEADYLEAISGKTAALMATSCRIGALTAGLPSDQVEALTQFGHGFGMVFQLRDDILDVLGPEQELGKPAGQDLAEGIYTLPVLRALADPDVGPQLRPLLGRTLGHADRDRARTMVASSPGIDAAWAMARGYAEEAVDALTGRVAPELADALAELAGALVHTLPAAS